MIEKTPHRLMGPWPYFIAVFAWTWLFWGAAALSRREIGEIPVPILIALGGLGPALAGIGFTWRTAGREGWGDYWRRVIDVWGVVTGLVVWLG